jgi:hypothetical protein
MGFWLLIPGVGMGGSSGSFSPLPQTAVDLSMAYEPGANLTAEYQTVLELTAEYQTAHELGMTVQ